MANSLIPPPPPNFTGKDLLTYTISNGAGNVAVGYIDVTVIPNVRPIIDLNGNDTSATLTFAENFVLGNYNNNSGTSNWAGAWIESNDDNNPNAGNIRIVTDGTPALRIGSASRSISRAANLTGYTNAVLSFDFRRVGFDDFNDFVVIEVSSNGTSFVEIGRFFGPANDATYSQFTADISTFISANTTIRFRTSADLAADEFLFVDNVAISAINPQTGFSNTFTKNGSPVAISATSGSGVVIIDQDSSNLSKAIVTITNPVPGDQLTIVGTLPTGITAQFSHGGTKLTLSGVATKAQYKSAIEQIRFSSTSENPTNVTRLIEVVAFDQTNLMSNVAIATISVIPVNDAPVDGDETINVTEDTPVSGNLLANASDVDGDSLTISGFSIAGESGPFVVGSAYTIASVGTLTIQANGDFTFVPAANYNGSVPLVTYTVSDGNGGTDTSTLTHVMIPVNDAPVDGDETINVTEDTPVSGNPLANASNVDGDSLTISGFSIAGEIGPFVVGSAYTIAGVGTLTIQANGDFTFVPAANYSGSVPLVTYTVSDGYGGTDTSTLTLVMIPVNDAPVDGDETINVTEDTPISGNLLANASDVDGDSLTISGFSIAGESGPFVVGTPYTIAGVGTLTIQANGNFTFVPAANYSGSVPLVTYTVSDGNGGTDTSTLTLVMIPVNDAPVDADETVSVTEDTPVSGNLLANASDVDGDSLTISGFSISGESGPFVVGTPYTIAGVGTLTIFSDGHFSFLPDPDFTGTVPAIAYTVTDGNGEFVTSVLQLEVIPQNDDPVAVDDFFETDQNTPISGNVTPGTPGQDFDVDGTFTVTHVGGEAITSGATIVLPSGALLTIHSDGQFHYDPNGVFNWLGSTRQGADYFEYTITDNRGASSTGRVFITIQGVDDLAILDGLNDGEIPGTDGTVHESGLPSGSQAGSGAAEHSETFRLWLAGSDETGSFSINGYSLTEAPTPSNPIVITGAHGILILTDYDFVTGTVSYTYQLTSSILTAGLVTDSFVMVQEDVDGDQVTGTLAIAIVNDRPQANADSATISEDSLVPVTGNVLSNDVIGADASGTSINGVWSGATLGIIGSPLTGNFGVLTLQADGSYSYLLNYLHPAVQGLGAGETLTDVFVYRLTDGDGDSGFASLTIQIMGVNNEPESSPISDQESVDGQMVHFDISSNFTDRDTTDVLVFSVTNGTLPPGLSLDPQTGIISGTIDSSASSNGPYIVTITATDSHGATSSQTFCWKVTNPGPIAVDDNYSVDAAFPNSLLGNVLVNDVDLDGDALSVIPQHQVRGSHGGLFTIAADGTITFDPNGEFDYLLVNDSLTTTIWYTLVDADGATSTASISVTVMGTNHLPVAQNDHFVLTGGQITGNAFTNDYDPDGHALSGSVIVGPEHGTLIWQANGTFTYRPGATFKGQDQFTYRVTDIHGASTTAVVFISQAFAWDAFRNEAVVQSGQPIFGGLSGGIEQIMSQRIESFGSQPILAGYATPGAILHGKIYSADGAILDEALVQVNSSGNWVMNFYRAVNSQNVIIMIDHLATEGVVLGDLHHFRLTDETYRSLQLGAEHHRVMTPGTILSDAPSRILEMMHQQNLNPLQLLY